MPSAPEKINARPVAFAPPSGREYESYDAYEHGNLILAAGTAFQTVLEASGRADAWFISLTGGPVEIRIRNRGEAARAPITMQSGGVQSLPIRGEILEARDPAGAGAQRVSATAHFGTRHIDRRENKGGPFLAHVHEHRDNAPEQVERR